MSLGPEQAYQNLKARFRVLSGLSGASSILYMDSMTAMKPGSSPDREEQTVAIASARYHMLTEPAVGEWLQQAIAGKDNLSPGDQKNLSLMHREWVIATALPEDLVRERARLELVGNNLHTEYRPTGNWSVMKPVYAQAFSVSRQIGDILKDKLGLNSSYEALLDQMNPGLKLATVEREFAILEAALPKMIAEAAAMQALRPPRLPILNIPVSDQAKINHNLLKALGFDEDRGIFYAGEMHPLSGGTPDDSRLTTRYNEDDMLDALYTTAHEGGHSLYEQATPFDWRYQPAGHSMGMDIHESQSMIIELHACRIPEFLHYLSHHAMATLDRRNDASLEMDNISRTLFHVEPSFIRIYADELTYPGHIILRYNLERALIEGSLSLDDMPDAWNSGMQKMFGIIPPDPSKGHMQDVHWPTLSIGYFPAYTFGAMGAAQFFAAATKAHPDIRNEAMIGKFGTLRQWLADNVHSKGSLFTQDEIFTAATGEPLNSKYYLNHLSRRYLGRDYSP